MQHFKTLAASFMLSILLISCKGDDPFTITPTSVGPLTQKTQVSEVSTLFANDSIIDKNSTENRQNDSGIITIYEKGGEKLLSLITATKADTATIKTIQIFDSRYKTEKGISTLSTFKELQDAYTINKVESLLSTIIVFVDEINAYFTIDKKELSGELQFGPGTKVEPAQIPDKAKIKYFMLGW
ncbi:hypothetical protein [Flavimarina sp. Hel_I_48]|uniref:hypothetical protein n=1 Tax=Flavimarina sp. Hel_I_48 TaxID=1392488 RepID=UPI00068A713A|nr:hypothetical protein [Flavimarina sp. Hel_I_48]